MNAYAISMATRLVFQPYVDLEAASQQLFNDATILLALQETRYLQARIPVPKAGNIHLAWEYAQEPAHHHRFSLRQYRYATCCPGNLSCYSLID